MRGLVLPRRALRSKLLRGTSAGAGALAMIAAATPAQAQLANLGHAVNNVVAPPPSAAGLTPVTTPTMVQIAARHEAYQARLSQQANIVANANAAARAAAAAAQQSIANGLAVGALRPVDLSAQNKSALTIWVGASQPTQTAVANPANGTTVQVDVNQTQSRALLSWESFNIGRETQLNFNQQGHTDWVVVNRVVGAIDPTTGLVDPARDPSPTQILGRIKADGTVFILNRSGVMFGATSQVDLHSLVASTLELGRTIVRNSSTDPRAPAFLHPSLDDLNNAFLQNGILPSDHVGLLGSIEGETHGAVSVAAGAQIRSTGGFVILAAPQVSMAGEINPGRDASGNAAKPAPGGQVSIVAGDYVDASTSTGADDSIDRYARGLVLSSLGGGSIDVSGSINAPEGYVSLVTDPTGIIDFSGIITATTSVARNGKISMVGGAVNFLTRNIKDSAGNDLLGSDGRAFAGTATLAITPDLSGATVPQAADSLAAFKTSQIDIGNYDLVLAGFGYGQLQTRNVATQGFVDGTLLPTLVNIGDSSLIYAPGADVNIGGTAGGKRFLASLYPTIGRTGVTVGANAVIDVSGLDNVQIAAERNQLVISPAKKNELRDTPVYRDPKTDGTFTLNGATLYIDPRLSGVRDDGVAWVGSPLIEAGSLADQIGITAPELLTKGGNVTLATMGVDQNTLGMVPKPLVSVDASATIDFSGGWANYQAGQIRTSQLITADGRLVDIGSADPNDIFIGLLDSVTQALPQLTTPYKFSNTLQTVSHFEPGYSEGHDAGSLNISAPTADFNARLYGQAVWGERQIIDAKAASATSAIAGDPRKLQANHGQLPSGGLLNFSTNLGGSILVGGDAAMAANGPPGLIHVLDSTINNAGLSGLVLQTSGAIAFARGGEIDLRPGGALGLTAGRAIAFNGNISVPAGSIDALTYGNRYGDLFDAGDDLAGNGVLTGTTPGWFDLFAIASGAPVPSDQGWFDISVNPGATLSTRGLWTNDLLVADNIFTGGAYTSGGSISLAVAPHIAAFTDTTQAHAVDLSGSILIASGSLLDVSGGGFISRTGELDLDGKGGDVTLTDETVYFQVQQKDSQSQYKGNVTGTNRFNSDLTTFSLTPVNTVGYDSAVVPDVLRNRVDLAAGTIRGFGFQGGGTFKLTTPDLAFGSSGGTGTAIPLDFLQDTGFATLDLTAWNTRLIDNVFANGRTGKTALLATEIVRINAGETLNLTQSVLPTLLSASNYSTLRAQRSGTDVSRLDILAPTSALGDFYNRPANLVLGGLTELDIVGGTITGAPGASITAPKIYQGGTIAIHGGSITQQSDLPISYLTAGLGIGQQTGDNAVDPVAALATIFGPANANGLYSETAFMALPGFGNVTIRDFLTKAGSDHLLYYLGRLAQDQGILFAAGSTTDLSGAVVLDPLAPFRGGLQLRKGRLVDGGTIMAQGRYFGVRSLFDPALTGQDGLGYRVESGAFVPGAQHDGLTIEADAGARIDISGATGFFDLSSGLGSLVAMPVWTNAGRLAGLGGGDVTQAFIKAAGGTVNARGGEFDWYNPVLRQNGSADVPEGAVESGNIVFADQLVASGFDSFVARGTLSTLGDVDLTLGRAFMLKSPDSQGSPDPGRFDDYTSTITATGDLSITAPHVVLSSITQIVRNLPEWRQGLFGDHKLTISAKAAVGTGASFDIIGAVGIDAAIGQVNFFSQGDIRLIGIQPIVNTLNPAAPLAVPSLSGAIVAAGRLTMQSREVYATTGTGNLLHDAGIVGDNIASYNGPFLIASLAHDTTGSPTVSFLSAPGTSATTPLSAGTHVQVLGENIFQGGALYAPIGQIDLGSRTPATIAGLNATISTSKLVLGNGSITSVSGAGLNIPYGTTIDLTDSYFSPTQISPLTGLPAAQLGLSADSITTDAGATVDASGGGSLYGYEFVSGTGGSRDLLSRFNPDLYSSLDGYQFPDGRQVYAILPANSPELAALYDPVYSSDYASLYGSDVGRTVTLDAVAESAPGRNDGLAAGQYVLLPAKYALLPGALRLVEDAGGTTPTANSSLRDIDGSLHVGGLYGIAGTQVQDPLRRSFTVQTQAVFSQYSLIKQTDAGTKVETAALQSGLVIPRLPNDAAKIVIDPGTGLTIGNSFQTSAKASPGGAPAAAARSISWATSSTSCRAPTMPDRAVSAS